MKVLVADNLSPAGIEILKNEDGIEVDVKTGMSKEELIEVIPEYEGLLVRSATKVRAEVIEAATNLKVVDGPVSGSTISTWKPPGKKALS